MRALVSHVEALKQINPAYVIPCHCTGWSATHQIAHAMHATRSPGDAPPLDPSSPVPGCACPVCLTLAAGGTWNDGELARDLVLVLSRLPQQDRVGAVHDLIA